MTCLTASVAIWALLSCSFAYGDSRAVILGFLCCNVRRYGQRCEVCYCVGVSPSSDLIGVPGKKMEVRADGVVSVGRMKSLVTSRSAERYFHTFT